MIPELKKLLSAENTQHVDKFAAYINYLPLAKNKQGGFKNPWAKQITPEKAASLFMEVKEEGLVFDGEDITLNTNGISYGYQAYKNKLLASYPETIIDLQLVYQDDKVEFSKKSGKVSYSHEMANPFGNSNDEVIGGYCVIKNRRGEFLTTLNKEDIQSRRNVAKTDSIWKQWFKEMAMKSVIKRACTFHFKDTYEKMEATDNQQYDLGKKPAEAESLKEILTLIESSKTPESLKLLDVRISKFANEATSDELQSVSEALREKTIDLSPEPVIVNPPKNGK